MPIHHLGEIIIEGPLLHYYYFFIAIGVLGTIFNAMFVAANVGTRHSPSSLLVLLVCLADFFFCLQASILGIGDALYGYYFWKDAVCSLQAVLIEWVCALSILTITGMAYERYVTTKKLQNLSWKGLWIMMSVVFAYASFLASLVLIGDTKDTVMLDNSGWACIPKWYSSYWSIRMLTLLSLGSIAICFVIMAYCYAQVYYRYKEAAVHQKKGTYLIQQKKILLKSIYLTLFFMTMWTPSLIKIGYNLIFEEDPNPFFSGTSFVFALANSAFNPILLLSFDNRARQLLRFKKDGSILARISSKQNSKSYTNENASQSRTTPMGTVVLGSRENNS